MENKLISIIIPVYNVEKYIAWCIESVLSQTYVYWELILVDDGTPDKSGAICDSYADKDTRIKVIHTENQGRSVARNVGLNNATGDWVVFIDSDDWVGSDYLSVMIHANPEWNVELLVSQGFYGITESGKPDDTYPAAIYKDWTFKVGELQDVIQSNNLLHRQAVWGRLFSLKKIKEAGCDFNPDVYNSEDGLFLHRYMLEVKKFSFISAREYYYVTPAKCKSDNRIDYNEMFELAKAYSCLSAKLIKHFNLEHYDYANRIIDMFQSRYAKLVLDKQCPFDLKKKAKQINHSILWHRKIHCLADLKLMMKYLLA